MNVQLVYIGNHSLLSLLPLEKKAGDLVNDTAAAYIELQREVRGIQPVREPGTCAGEPCELLAGCRLSVNTPVKGERRKTLRGEFAQI